MAKQAQNEKQQADSARVRVAVVEAAKQLKETFICREEAIDAIWVAMLAGVNFILVGEPGTAKTALVMSAFAHVSDARRFDTLCGSFVTPDQIFGPIDVMGMKNGEFRRVTKGRLADCELAFLDELLKSNQGAVNATLTAMNERMFEGVKIPLRCCGSATNWPEVKSKSEHVAAFWDRILVRVPVERIEKEELRVKLLEASERVAAYKPRATITVEELDQARAEVEKIEVRELMRRMLVRVGQTIAGIGVKLSDRRLAMVQRVLRASAWLAGRDKVELDDFDALRFCAWEESEPQYKAAKACTDGLDQEALRTVLAQLNDAIKQCAQAKTPESAPEMAKRAADIANKLNDYVDKNAIRRANWDKHVRPKVQELAKEQSRLTSMIQNGLPKASSAQAKPAAPQVEVKKPAAPSGGTI